MAGTFHIQNFGCRASQADGAAIASQLQRGGWVASGAAEASLVVLNSCTVTEAADRDLEKAVRRAHRENPSARILVTGCYAQRAPEQLAVLEGVAWVVGNSHKDRIAEVIAAAPEYHAQIHLTDIFARREFFSAPIEDAAAGRSRPVLKIQDGCNNRCAFCIIPSVRGASRSASPEWVLEQVRQLAAHFREVVLTGVNLGRWGREWGQGRQLADLLRRLLAETTVARLRLSSIEPMDWTDELIELVAGESRIAHHVHAPLQSGSDAVLRRMHRRYRPRHYRDRLERAHHLMPNAAFGADVMTGFPGETDAEFEESYRFIADSPLTYLHVFTYSERPGTKAADLTGMVPMAVRRERTRRLIALGEEKQQAFRARQVGRELEVVTTGGLEAMSSNFLRVQLAIPEAAQTVRRARIGSIGQDALLEAGALPIFSGRSDAPSTVTTHLGEARAAALRGSGCSN